MSYKWIGAVLVIVGCGGFGFAMAAGHRREVRLLRQLHRGLLFMESELKYRLTPLPELCRQTGKEMGGVLRQIFFTLAQELDSRTLPDPGDCMAWAIQNTRESLPGSLRKLLTRLGRSLGRFDLTGQLRGLEALSGACEEELARLNQNKDIRLRNYQTLGLCAGAALAILFA